MPDHAADPAAFWRERAADWREHAAGWQERLDAGNAPPEAEALYRKGVHACLGLAVVCDQWVAYHEKYPQPVAAGNARQEGVSRAD